MIIYQRRDREKEREITYSYFPVMKTNEPSVFICAAFHIYIKGRSKTIPRYVFTASRNILIFQINIRIMLKQLSIVTLVSLRQVYKHVWVHFNFLNLWVEG